MHTTKTPTKTIERQRREDHTATGDNDPMIDFMPHGLPSNLVNRLVAVVLIEAIKSAPNIDPFLGTPRSDDWGHSEISPGCAKRQPRDFLHDVGGVALHHDRGADLKIVQERYREADNRVNVEKMRADLWDLRVFGGVPVISGAPKMRGAVQFSQFTSIDPVNIQAVPFSSSVGTGKEKVVQSPTAKKAAKKGPKGVAVDPNAPAVDPVTEKYLSTPFTAYHIVPYALYKGIITINPFTAKANGLTANDIDMLWHGIIKGWEHSISAHRTQVNVRRIYTFDTGHPTGIEPGHVTTDRIKVNRISEDNPRTFEDYEIEVNLDRMHPRMKLFRWEDGPVGELAAAAK